MDGILKGKPPWAVIVAVALFVVAWGRIAVMAVVNPSPWREMRMGDYAARGVTGTRCAGMDVIDGDVLYRWRCAVSLDSGAPSAYDYDGLFRFDMARGTLDAIWRIQDDDVDSRRNNLADFSTALDDGIGVSFDDDVKGENLRYFQLLPRGGVEPMDAPAGGRFAETVTNEPSSDPKSMDRLSSDVLGTQWLEVRENDIIIGPSGKLVTAPIRAGSRMLFAGEDLSKDLLAYNFVWSGDRWLVIELKGSGPFYLALSEDGADAPSAVVPNVRLQYAGLDVRLAAPDPAGGLWLLNDAGDYAHFDASLRRTDPLNFLERFQRVAVDNFRLYQPPSPGDPDLLDVFNPTLGLLKQLALPVILLALPILLVLAYRAWRSYKPEPYGPFLESIQLRSLAQVYIGLCIVFGFWFWHVTALF